MNKEFDVGKIIGVPALLEQTAEEASELAQACLKMSRKLRGENPTPKNMIQIRNELIEEIADVMNCLEQIVEYSDVINAGGSISHESIDSMRIYKMERWEQRLNTVDASDIEKIADKFSRDNIIFPDEFLNKNMNIHHPSGKLPEPDKERRVKSIQYTYDPITHTNRRIVVYDDETIDYVDEAIEYVY